MRWFLLCLLTAATLWWKTDDAAWTQPDQAIVPLRESTQALMVDAVLNQKVPGVFIVDTGATYTSISRQMAEDLGLDLENGEKITITTANGRIQVPKVHIKRLALKGIVGHDIEATVMDIKPGSSFSGLLGLSFMKQYRVTIDPESRQLIFENNKRQLAIVAPAREYPATDDLINFLLLPMVGHQTGWPLRKDEDRSVNYTSYTSCRSVSRNRGRAL